MGNLFSSRKTVDITSEQKTKKKHKSEKNDLTENAVITPNSTDVVNGGPEKLLDVTNAEQQPEQQTFTAEQASTTEQQQASTAEQQASTTVRTSGLSSTSGSSETRPQSNRVSELNFKDVGANKFFQEVMSSVGGLQHERPLNEEDEREVEQNVSQSTVHDHKEGKDINTKNTNQNNRQTTDIITTENHSNQAEDKKIRRKEDGQEKNDEVINDKQAEATGMTIPAVKVDNDNTDSTLQGNIARSTNTNDDTKKNSQVSVTSGIINDECANKDKDNQANEVEAEKENKRSVEQVQEVVKEDAQGETSGTSKINPKTTEEAGETPKYDQLHLQTSESALTVEPKNTHSDKGTVEARVDTAIEPISSAPNDQEADNNASVVNGITNRQDHVIDAKDTAGGNATAEVAASGPNGGQNSNETGTKNKSPEETKDTEVKTESDNSKDSPRLDDMVEEVRRSFLYLDQLDDSDLDDLEEVSDLDESDSSDEKTKSENITEDSPNTNQATKGSEDDKSNTATDKPVQFQIGS